MKVGDRVILIDEGRSGTVTGITSEAEFEIDLVGAGPIVHGPRGLRPANQDEGGANDGKPRE